MWCHYLARVWPLLMVLLGVYERGTGSKLWDVRIYVEETVIVRDGDASCEYE